MKKNGLYRTLLLIGLISLPVLAYAQGASDITRGFSSFGGIINSFTSNIVKALATLFATGAMAAFFYGIVEYIIGIRGGDKNKIDSGNKFMIWGLVALFVMFSVWGIIRFFQGVLLGSSNTNTITIPQIILQNGSSGSTNSNGTTNSPGSNSVVFPCASNGGTYADYNTYISQCPGAISSPSSSSGTSGSSGASQQTSGSVNATVGADCTTNAECGGSLVCRNYTCQQPASAGDATAAGYDPGATVYHCDANNGTYYDYNAYMAQCPSVQH